LQTLKLGSFFRIYIIFYVLSPKGLLYIPQGIISFASSSLLQHSLRMQQDMSTGWEEEETSVDECSTHNASRAEPQFPKYKNLPEGDTIHDLGSRATAK
jgi:hypothetical protein